jgi:hypothetical protein
VGEEGLAEPGAAAGQQKPPALLQRCEEREPEQQAEHEQQQQQEQEQQQELLQDQEQQHEQPPPSAPSDSQAPPQQQQQQQQHEAAAADEVRRLRSQNAQLREEAARLHALHSRELASVLCDAAAHEAAALSRAVTAAAAAAVAAERARWVSSLAALGVPPPALLRLALGAPLGGDGGGGLGPEVATSAAAAAIAAAAAAARGGAGAGRALDARLLYAMQCMATAGASVESNVPLEPAPEEDLDLGLLAAAACLPSVSVAPPDPPQGHRAAGLGAAAGEDTPHVLSDSLLEHLRGEFQGGGSCFVAAVRCSTPSSGDGPCGHRASGGASEDTAARQARPRGQLPSSCSWSSSGGADDAVWGGSDGWGSDPVVSPAPAAAPLSAPIGARAGGRGGCNSGSGPVLAAAFADQAAALLPDDLL